MQLSTWIGLILCNLAWSMNPAVAKRIIQEIGPEHTALLKYVVALLAYVVVRVSLQIAGQKPSTAPAKDQSLAMTSGPEQNVEHEQAKTSRRRDERERLATEPLFMPMKPRKDFILAVLIGVATCFLSPLLQMSGLEASTAINNSILVTFEPIFTVFLGWILYRERLSKSHFLSFFLATIGFFYLSGVLYAYSGGNSPSSQNLSTGPLSGPPFFNYGDFVLLLAVAGEAVYSVLARRLTHRHPPTAIFGTAILVGVLFMSIAVIPWKGLPPLHLLTLTGWCALLWFGILGTAIPYLYWLYALNQSLSLGSVALSLFLQPLIGTLAGVFILHEPLGPKQILGGSLILLAVTFQIFAEQLNTTPKYN